MLTMTSHLCGKASGAIFVFVFVFGQCSPVVDQPYVWKGKLGYIGIFIYIYVCICNCNCIWTVLTSHLYGRASGFDPRKLNWPQHQSWQCQVALRANTQNTNTTNEMIQTHKNKYYEWNYSNTQIQIQLMKWFKYTNANTVNEMIQIHKHNEWNDFQIQKYKYNEFNDSNTQIHIQLKKNERKKLNTATQIYNVLARGHVRYILY